MTLKVQAFQRDGIKTKELVDTFAFCCWQDLDNWLGTFSELNKCPKCKSKTPYVELQKMTNDEFIAWLKKNKNNKAFKNEIRRWLRLQNV